MSENETMIKSHNVPTRRVLALSTTGGFTHAAPVLDICRVLADRGHAVEFATHDGQQTWIQNPNYAFISKVHLLGPGPTAEQYDNHWARMVRLRVEDALSSWLMWKSKYLWDSFWPATYRQLKRLCCDPETRPDFIIADFFDETVARDMNLECGVPIAIVWPQMPYLLAPAPYIPGQPGFQIDCGRLLNFWRGCGGSRSCGVERAPVIPSCPAATVPIILCSSTHFSASKPPRTYRLSWSPWGLCLAEQYPPLDERHARFLETHHDVVYVGLGTHVVLPESSLHKLLQGLLLALDGGRIDGIIWPMNQKTRETLDLSHVVSRAGGKVSTLGQLLDGTMSDLMVVDFAPQGAILDHSHTRLYVTRAGGSSANEAAYHGVPVLVLGFMFDQLANGMRLEEAGCGHRLDKNSFTADEVVERVSSMASSGTGALTRNVERLRRIATVAARRKGLAADLVEEVLYDAELRGPSRPMHLQTADMRMPWWKVHNLDLGVFALATLVGLPAVAIYSVQSLVRGRVPFTPLWRAVFALRQLLATR
ncbi:udp-glucosyl transferase family [Fusarium albosuccineum]|uniref:Udp-glucosyl transferase family n=1 Tax=Fusarium albosuccineum TaxID=1237068 RepID=A0A8H4LAD9_9HYPO|nr:udp-glucosyl transferase family [Fusarium albosuccineum]